MSAAMGVRVQADLLQSITLCRSSRYGQDSWSTCRDRGQTGAAPGPTRTLADMADTIAPSETSIEQFRDEALAFLEANAKPRQKIEQKWGEGSDRVNLLSEKTREEEIEEVRAAKDWKAREFDAGF